MANNQFGMSSLVFGQGLPLLKGGRQSSRDFLLVPMQFVPLLQPIDPPGSIFRGHSALLGFSVLILLLLPMDRLDVGTREGRET